ncbi:unnamed protein product [Merluccius merluccius]
MTQSTRASSQRGTDVSLPLDVSSPLAPTSPLLTSHMSPPPTQSTSDLSRVPGDLMTSPLTPRATSTLNTTLHTTSNTTEEGAVEDEEVVVLNASLVAIITILSIVVVLVVLVVVCRSLGLLKPSFEWLDNMPLKTLSTVLPAITKLILLIIFI